MRYGHVLVITFPPSSLHPSTRQPRRFSRPTRTEVSTGVRPPAALPLRNDEAELAVVILRVRLVGVRRRRRVDVHDVIAAGDERERYAARRRRPRSQRRHREARRVNEIRGYAPKY